MSDDPTRDVILEDLIWLRRQRGDFGSRIARALRLIDIIGGGSLRNARAELERIRRDALRDRESDVAAYFETAGYRVKGETLDQRLTSYAKRHHVVARTALRRSDRGAAVVAELIRDRLRYERPQAFVLAFQRETWLSVWVAFYASEETDLGLPVVHVNGESIELPIDRTPYEGLPGERVQHRLPPIELDPSVNEDTPLAKLSVAWVPRVAPICELVAQMADDRLYGRFTTHPSHLVRFEVRWWDASAAGTREWPLNQGRV